MRHPVTDTAAALPGRSGRLRAVLRALRPYQWVKNGLLFAPLVLAHRQGELPLLWSAVIAFVAFSLGASAGYIGNDVLDVGSDRRHPVKRFRPFASGELPLRTGYVLAPLLGVAAFGVALAALPLLFSALLALYLGTAVLYSFVLKRFAIIDVLTLAGLYTLRILSGAVATGVVVSEWLLAFSLFFFVNLAFLKRYAELTLLQTNLEARQNRRGYTVEDLGLLRVLGPVSGYLAVLVFAQYITSAGVTVLYARPILLWLAGPLLLYWITRLWLLANRGHLYDDPILFTAKDPASWVVGILIAAVLVAAAV